MGLMDLSALPVGQQRVCENLLDAHCYTYSEVAGLLGISAGTVRQHLARMRANHPALYRRLMAARRRQLAERHERALAREDLRRGGLHLYEKRLHGYQVGIDMHGLVAATAFHALTPAEVDDVVNQARVILPAPRPAFVNVPLSELRNDLPS